MLKNELVKKGAEILEGRVTSFGDIFAEYKALEKAGFWFLYWVI